MKKFISSILIIFALALQAIAAPTPQPPNSKTTEKLKNTIEKKGGMNDYWYKNSNWLPKPSTPWNTIKQELLKSHPSINQSLAENGKFSGILLIDLDKKGKIKYADFLYSSKNDTALMNAVLQSIYPLIFQFPPNSPTKRSFEPFKTYFDIKTDKSLLTPSTASIVPDSVNNPWKSLDTATLAAINKFEFPPSAENPKARMDASIWQDSGFKRAQFFGGDIAFQRLIMDNFQYPPRCMEAGLSGNVQLKFRVNRDGIVDKITTITKTPECPEFTAEAKRIIQIAPWIPATYKGRTINCWMAIPISLSMK